MNCAISSEQQERFGTEVVRNLLASIEDQQSFDLKGYMQSIYDEVKELSGDHGRAVDYARLVPFFINQISFVDPQIGKSLRELGLNMEELADLVAQLSDETEGVPALEKYLEIGTDIVKDLAEDNSQITEEVPVEEEPVEVPVESSTPITRSFNFMGDIMSDLIPKLKKDFWKAFAPTVMADRIQEALSYDKTSPDYNVADPAQAFYFKVKRDVLKQLGKAGVDYDSSNMDFYGNGPVFLTAMSIDQIPEDQLRPGHDWAADPEHTGVVLALTDRYGMPIGLDPTTGMPVASGGKIAYYSLRNTKDNFDANGNLVLTNSDKHSITAMSKQRKISRDAAEAEYRREIQLVHDMRKYVNENKMNNTVQNKINGGSLGYIQRDYNLRTPLKNIDFGTQSFNPNAYDVTDPTKGIIAGRTYFTVDEMYGQLIEIERPTVQESGFAEKLTSLIVDDIVDESGTPLDPAERQAFLDTYFMTGPESIQLFPDRDDSSKHVVKLRGKAMDLSTPEAKEVAREKIQSFFTELGPTRELTAEEVKRRQSDRQRRNLSPLKIIKTTTPDFKNAYEVNAVVQLVTPQGQADKFYVVDMQKLHLKNIVGNFTDFTLSKDGERTTLTRETYPHKNWIRENFLMQYPLNNQNQLVKMNAYFTFEPSQQEIDKMYPVEEQEQEIVDEVEQGPAQTELNEQGPADENLDDLMDDTWSDEELARNAGVSAANKKATEKQIKEAKTWYEASPLSKHVPFEVMFNVINTKNPDNVATWAVHGITLFQGSDYSALYHEAWHAFTQMFLTKEQKTSLYNELRNRSGSFSDFKGHRVSFRKATNLQLEEFMAEDFRTYMLSGGKKTKSNSPKRNKIFQWILKALEALFGGSNSKQVTLNEKIDNNIASLYEKLRVGNLTEYNFSAENVMFGALNSGVQSWNTDAKVVALSYENSSQILSMMDSLFSEYTDRSNARLNSNELLRLSELEARLESGALNMEQRKDLSAQLESLKSKQTYKFTTAILKSPAQLGRAYKYARIKLATIHNALVEKYEAEENGTAKTRLKKDIDLLAWTIAEFGDVENMANNKFDEASDIKGVIGYHMHKSKKFFGEVADLLDYENMSEEDTFVKGREGYDRMGNETSFLDLAKPEVLYMLKSLHKVDENGEVVNNRFGVPELAPFQEVWNRLARTLQNTTSAEKMYEKLLKESESYAPFKQLLNKLGPVMTGSMSEANLWTNFWQTFNLTRVPLIQMTVEKSEDLYESRIGEAFADYRKVGRRWQSEFHQADHNTSPYIENDAGGNYLNLGKIIADFSNNLNGREFEFMRAMGLNMTNVPEIQNAIGKSEYGAPWFLRRLKYLKSRGDIKVRNFSDLIKNYDPIKIGDKVYEKNEGLNKRFKTIQELEARYSDQVSNFMVTNAEGNTQFEHSLNNSLTMMVNSLNDETITNYKSLIKIPHMSHLDIARNPFAAASTWLNSLFILDVATTDVDYGKRRTVDNKPDSPVVKLQLSNLSGVLLTEEGSETADGIASAKADEVTKLILDFHLMSQLGVPELMRHADKGTSFSTSLTSIQTPDGSKSRYVEGIDFLRGEASYHRLAMDIILPHIEAELTRIGMMRDMAAANVENFDFDYMKRGENFVTFDDVLSRKTKQDLISLQATGMSMEEILSPEMRTAIMKDSAEYFEKQIEKVRKKLSENEFIAGNVLTKFKQEARANNLTANNAEAKDALIKSFVYNSWIHNIESISIIYGDMAQYNHIKEEFHKRNAGAGSTGRIYRTDQAMQDYINTSLGKGYAEKNKDSLGLDTIAGYDGTMNTAIIQDNEIKSAYYDEYLEAIGDKEAAKAYSTKGMNEGDAQGWITFDSYRIMKTAEGTWTAEQESLYQRIIKDEEVRPQDVGKFFSTVKAQYFGPLSTEGLPITAFHKFSLFPLIPSVIKGTNLEKLHNKMVKENIDYATFESGSKVGTITKAGERDKGYTKDRQLSNEVFTPNTIFMEYLKDQLEIAPEFKGNVIFSTQLRKLIEDGLYQQGQAITPEIEKIIKRYEGNIRELTEVKKKQLLKEANWTMDENGDPQGNIEDLMKFVKNELTRQDLSDHEIDFIQIKDGHLKYDLSLSLSAEKIEKLLNSLVTKRLVKQKVNGEGLIQVSGALFESDASTQDRNYTNPTEEDLKKWGTNDLPTYHKGKDGKTQAMKVKIALQGDFMHLLQATDKEGERIGTIEKLNELIRDEEWLNMGDNRRMITMVGVRIPVQGLNSMEFMEVYEFLGTEAGNIIIPPAEIVAKSGSDYDIDKLTVMMPNIKRGNRKNPARLKNYSEAEVKSLYDQYKEAKIESAKIDDVDDAWAYNNLMESIFGVSMEELESELEDMLLETGELQTFDEFKEKLTGSKAVENELIWDIKSILELPENYATLIRPNGTDIVEPIAKELAPYVMEFDPKDVVHGDRRTATVKGKEQDVISPTRALEVEYNLYKHASNNIGKQTLGLGAVDNTYNSVFNRIGAHMNATVGITTKRYDKLVEKQKSGRRLTKQENKDLQKYKVQRLLLPHNSVMVKGEKAISLSHVDDSNGDYRISDVINQLLNGWLDIAKDAWIFNIQGNKEIAPSLLFMIQAGVPVKQAIYFVSMPMVRKYVDEQRLAKSTFAEPLGKAPENPMFFRNKAREEIMSSPEYGFNISPEEGGRRLNSTLKSLSKDLKGTFESADLKKAIVKYSDTTKSGGTYEYTQEDRDAFLHFLEIEDMSKAVRDIKLKMNFDTSKSGTLFEAQNRVMMKEGLRQDDRIPADIVDKIISDSPIGSFFIQPFQLKIWKDAFGLRNHQAVNEFLLGKMREGNMADVRNTFGDNEIFANEFRNDFTNFIFQNALKQFNITNVDSYRGYEVDASVPVSRVTSLKFGAYVKDGTLYYDKKQLKEDFRTKAYKDKSYYTERGLAKVSSRAFNTPDEYFNFVFERETLRASQPFAMISGTKSFTQKRNVVAANYAQETDESTEAYKTRIDKLAYETYLRDSALDNTFNHWKLFKSQDSYADQFNILRTAYPELKEDFALMRQLSVGTSKIGYTNLKLNDTNLDGEMLNLLHENLMNLSNSQVQKVEDPVENERISDFFRRFSVVAFLQSGMSTKSQFSLTRIASPEMFLRLMEEPVSKYMSHLDASIKAKKTAPILEEFYQDFVAVNGMQNRQSRIRGKDYSTDFTLQASEKMMKEGKTIVEVTEAYTEPFVDPLVNVHAVEYNPTIKSYNGPAMTPAITADLAQKNPDVVIVYNFAMDNQANATVGDHSFFGVDSNNVIGLPTRLKYAGAGQRIEDVEGAIDPRVKDAIDSTIADLKERQQAGQTMAFNTEGYGQYMIGKAEDSGMVAPQTFLYLSKQLYEELGFINPNYLATRTGRVVVQSTQPISDEQVQDFMNHCF